MIQMHNVFNGQWQAHNMIEMYNVFNGQWQAHNIIKYYSNTSNIF